MAVAKHANAVKGGSGLSPSDALKTFRRAVHSKKDLRAGLSNARSTVPAAMFHEIVLAMSGNPVYRLLFAGEPFPANYSSLKIRARLQILEPAREIAWASAVLSLYVTELREFVKLRTRYENYFLVGEYKIGNDTLNSIEKRFGVSLWSTAARLQLLQLTEGLAAQKRFLETILRVDGINPFVALLGYYFSIRSEENLSLQALEDEAGELFDAPNLNDYTIYHIIPYYIHKITNPANLIGFEETQPIIDRFQALTVALQIQYVRERGPKRYITDALRLIAGTGDPRIIRLLDLSEGNLVNRAPLKYLPYCDLYTEGVYDTIRRVFSEQNLDDPYIAGMLELAARAETYRFKEEDEEVTSILDKSIGAMRDVLILSEDYQKSILSLKKLALTCAQQPACIFIASFVQRSHNFVLVQSYSDLDAIAALNSAPDNPWYADLVEEVFDGRGYLDGFLRTVPNSPTLRLRQLMRLPYLQAKFALAELKVPEYRRLIYHGHLCVMHDKMDEAVNYYRRALSSTAKLPYVNAREFLYKALFAMGEIAQCIELVCDHYLENQHAFRLYPLEELLNEALKRKHEDLGLGLPIIGFMTAHHVAPQRERDLSDLYENFMDSLNLSRPSEIDPQIASRARFIFFLRHICTPRILDDSVIFEGVSDVEHERIAICQMLTELDPANSEIYSSEIRSITKEAEVARLLRSVEESKIYADEEGIRTVVQDHLRDAYARYKQLLDLPLLQYQTEIISKRLEVLLAEKAHSETMNIRIPSSERETLFGNMYTTVVSNFAAHPAYGLDTYLSTGVRHGAFEGHLRSPMAARDLLSERDAKRGEYRENQYWARRFGDFPRSELSHIHRRLGRFSRTVDESITQFKKDLLQIRAADTPEGLFSFRITREEQLALMAEISSSTTYEEFMDKLLRECWATTERSMAVVQRELRSRLQAQINAAFDSLIQSIEQVVSHDRVKELIDAIVSARTEFQAAMDHVCSWFHRATQTNREPFYLDVALEVALKQIENCYSKQPVLPIKSIDIEYLIKGQFLDGIVEIFFILLQNVIRHSGFESTNPNVIIAAFETDDYFQIEVKNDLSPSVDIDERREVIAEAIKRYEHDTAMRMARQEGGSGLSKLWRILEFQLQVKHRLSMSISSNRRFEVLLSFDATELRA
jgi:hypothetical protein